MSFNRLAREEPSVGQEKRKRLHGNVRPARRKRKVEETIWKRKRGKRERERKKRRLGGCDRWDRCSFDRVLRLLRSQESPASPCSVDRRRSCWLRPLGFTGFYLGFAGLRFHKINKVIEIRWSLVFQVFPIHQNGREFSTSLGGFFLIFIHFCHSLTTFESAQRGWTVFCCVLSCFHLKGVPQRPEKKVAAAAEPLPIKSAPTAADSSVDLLERRRRQLALPRRPPPHPDLPHRRCTLRAIAVRYRSFARRRRRRRQNHLNTRAKNPQRRECAVTARNIQQLGSSRRLRIGQTVTGESNLNFFRPPYSLRLCQSSCGVELLKAIRMRM